jgi:hypothetical protein
LWFWLRVGTLREKESIMIELTPEQAQALEAGGDALPQVTNPRTGKTFVLVPREVYEVMQKWMSSFNRAGWDDPALDVYEEYRDQP